jgi:hypothetical protein
VPSKQITLNMSNDGKWAVAIGDWPWLPIAQERNGLSGRDTLCVDDRSPCETKIGLREFGKQETDTLDGRIEVQLWRYGVYSYSEFLLFIRAPRR